MAVFHIDMLRSLSALPFTVSLALLRLNQGCSDLPSGARHLEQLAFALTFNMAARPMQTTGSICHLDPSWSVQLLAQIQMLAGACLSELQLHVGNEAGHVFHYRTVGCAGHRVCSLATLIQNIF